MTAGDQAPASAPAGIAATWRATPPAVRAVIAGIFVNRLGGFLQAFLVLYLIRCGYSSQHAAVALAANGAGAIAGLMAGSRLVDRIGARRAVGSSMMMTAVLTAAIPEISSYPVMLVTVTAIGGSSQVYRPVSASVVGRGMAAEHRVMVFAMYRLAQNAGTTAAPLIGIALVSFSYPLLFWTEACAAAACAMIGWRALDGAEGRLDGSPGNIAPRSAYRAMLRDVRFLLFLLGMGVYAAVYIENVVVVPLAVRAEGWPPALYGVLLAVNGFIVISCELLVTTKVRHWPRRVAVFCGMSLVAAGMTAYIFPLGRAGFIVATVIWSVGEILCTPTLVASPVQAAADSRLVSSYIGASQVAFGIGSALGPVIGVALWDGMRGGVWFVFGVAGLLAAAVTTAGIRDG